MFTNRPSLPHLPSRNPTLTEKNNNTTTTTTTTTALDTLDKPPDGGITAWLQVAGGFALFFNSWGIMSSYGVFQTHYQTTLPSTSADAIAWIGSIQSFLLLLVGVLVGPLYDAGHLRPLTLAGVALIFLGFFAASFATRYWHVLLSQAFCVGLGAGCIYIPAVALVPQYFLARRRALATAVVATGSSIGGVVYPLLFQTLLARVGFPWAARTLAFVSLATNAFAVAVLRPRGSLTRRPRRVMLDLSAYRDLSFVLFSVAMFFNFWSYMAPIYYLEQYALALGAAAEEEDGGRSGVAYYLIAILNGGSVLGRLLPAWLAGRFGPINMLLAVSVSVAVVSMCWLAVKDGPGSVAFAAAWGFASGGLTSLPPTVVSTLVPDLSVHGTWLGMVSTTNAFASLSGPPIAGALLEATGGYLGVQLLSGLGMVTMTLFVLALRVSRIGKSRGWVA